MQVLAAASDGVIAHQKLAHRDGLNCGSDIRYQVFFQLCHKRHKEFAESGALLDDL